MNDGYIRVASISPKVRVADVFYNSKQIIAHVKTAYENGASLAIFPELSVTAYTCGDLFLHEKLLSTALESVKSIAKETSDLDILFAVGLPIRYNCKLYNCAVFIKNGVILGVIPKIYLPNYNEFYEARYFSSGKGISGAIPELSNAPFGQIIFQSNISNFSVSAEICEDLWTVNPPSNELSLAGATIIANLSASNEVIGKSEYRKNLVKSQSARLIAGYIYSNASIGESTTDMVFSGEKFICDNGEILSQSKKFCSDQEIIYGDIDLQKLASERQLMTTFNSEKSDKIKIVAFETKHKNLELLRKYPRFPFVPNDKNSLVERCEEILTMQATGLLTRLQHINCKNVVIGLSGGLDSTLALIVAVRAFDLLKLDRKGILSVTMPCFGTTSRTKSNAEKLAFEYGVSFLDVNITKSVRQHLSDINHSEEIHDVTYENAQARERTQVLMDLANKNSGIVIGTGDLSELALGWATYNGDHISMYGVNASIPKTLVRHLVDYEAKSTENTSLSGVLLDILDTPVSPELLPPKDGVISQKTEDLVGPYELHDFFLYYFLRCKFSPEKILRLAQNSFDGDYSVEEIKKWLDIFIKRFFSQQFKRSCLPDGPKIGSVSLSPRADLRLPSDASSIIFR